MNNISGYIMTFVLGGLLSWFFFVYNKPDKTIIDVRTDTVTKFVTYPEIQYEVQTSFIKKFVPDSVSRKKADSLFSELECLKAEMLKNNLQYTAVLDTAINNDTLYVTHEYLTKQWYINLRFAERAIKVEREIVYIYDKEKSNDKYWYGAAGFVIGGIIGVVIK